MNFKELREEAEAAGFGGLLPDGDFDLEIVGGSHRTAQSGNVNFGVQWKVQSGPKAGTSAWDNQTLSQKGAGFFFKWAYARGLDNDFFDGLPDDPEQAAPQIIAAMQGFKAKVRVGQRTWGNPPKTDNTFTVLETLGRAGVLPAPAPLAATPPPPAPAPEPAPAAPQPDIVPGPAPAPAAPVAPPADDVEALKAQLAALTAQQAPAAPAAAPAAPARPF